MTKKNVPFYKKLHNQVLMGIALGIVLGLLAPELAVKMRPLGDAFIKAIRMMIAPIVFCIIVSGIAGMGSAKMVGSVGIKTLGYFYALSSLALVIGLVAANVIKPGEGMNADPATINAGTVQNYASQAEAQSTVQFIMNIIPEQMMDAFAKGNILQVLMIALLFGFALHSVGERGQQVKDLIDKVTKVLFAIIEIIVVISPLGAFGAMAYTIGAFGLTALVPLLKLIITFALTCAFFIAVLILPIARYVGFSLLKLCRYILEEILIQLSVSSSEVVMPRLMEKLERLGISKSVVGLVVPAGYSFNLDGTNIYMTFCVLFIAQATNTDLTLGQQLAVLFVAMLTSKGSTGFAGAGFVVLAATLAVVPSVPMAGLALILGIDPFMSRIRGLTNFIGNASAAVVIAAWVKEVDMPELRKRLDAGPDMDIHTAAKL